MQMAVQRLLNKLAEGYQIIDREWRYVYLNDAAVTQSRRPRDELIGRTIMECYPGIETTPMFRSLRKSLEKQVPVRVENLFTYPDDTERWFDLRIEPVPEGVLILSIDITSEKLVDRSKTEFVALASHQLRTPTSIILWETEDLLSKSKALSATERQALQHIARANDRSIRIIDTLLHISRLEAGTAESRPQHVHVRTFIANEISQFDHHVHTRKLHIALHCPADTPDLFIDPDFLQIILHNLLSNAVKYTPPGGKITISVTHDTRKVHFAVTDTGCGIPKKQQSHIFTKLFRADNAKDINTEGSGLGLYLARLLARSMRGDVTFKSTENIGTTFYVSLPLVSKVRKGKVT